MMPNIDQELQRLRALFEAAISANLALFEHTMKCHGRSLEFRTAALEDVRGVELDRMRTALMECEAALMREGCTIQ